MKTSFRRAAAQDATSGFTLIEMIVAIAIMAILVGAAVPVTSKVLTYKARKATREELQALAEAVLEHFRDTGTLPGGVDDLLVDSGAGGWTGPYLPGVVADHVTGASGYEVDAWSRAYTFSAADDALTVRSRGEDAASGTADDLVIVVDVTVVRREHTRDELKVLNQAITLYNGVHMATSPLPPTWAAAFNTLVAQGYLPNDSDYLTDGWGQAYAPTGNPVVELRSTSM